MLNTTFVRVREDALPRLREWLRGLEDRREELRASYATEGTLQEQFFVVRGADGPILVLVTELENRRRGEESFLRSHMRLDVEFKNLIQEVGLGEPDLELLFDSSAYFAGTAT